MSGVSAAETVRECEVLRLGVTWTVVPPDREVCPLRWDAKTGGIGGGRGVSYS